MQLAIAKSTLAAEATSIGGGNWCQKLAWKVWKRCSNDVCITLRFDSMKVGHSKGNCGNEKLVDSGGALLQCRAARGSCAAAAGGCTVPDVQWHSGAPARELRQHRLQQALPCLPHLQGECLELSEISLFSPYRLECFGQPLLIQPLDMPVATESAALCLPTPVDIAYILSKGCCM